MKQLFLKSQILLYAVLDAYSVILFGQNKTHGFLILLATMLIPVVGLAGLIGLVFSLLFTRLTGFDTWDSPSGLLSFNSLLTCLGVGFYLPYQSFGWQYYITTILVISLITTFFFITINSLTTYQLRLPSMSITFSLTTILLLLFYRNLGYTLSPQNHIMYVSMENIPLPAFFEYYCKSLGSIFFLPYNLPGLIVALSLLLNSRIAFLLSLLGFAIAYLFLGNFGFYQTGDLMFSGLNAILIAISIGGIFIVPSKLSYLMAALASFLGIFIFIAIQKLFAVIDVPSYTFPLMITVYIIVYSFRLRLKNENPYLVDFGIYHPEENLKYFFVKIKRFYQTGSPQFYLPVIGEWKISQGNDGEITHKYKWAYAWDFEIFDTQNKNYRSNPLSKEDYYCFNKPVICSADGFVSKVIDGIEDNPINQINTKENWGNVVTINHGLGVYSLYGHLKKGSIKVKLGEYISKGEKIGSVGNSGRSAVPHLHFNIQLGAEPGAQTLKAFLANFKSRMSYDEKYTFQPYQIPVQDTYLSQLVPALNLQDQLHLKVGDINKFQVNLGGKSFEESWEINTSFLGQLFIKSSQKACIEFSFYDGIFNVLSFSGNRNSALFALSAVLSRLPYQENTKLEWKDAPPISVFIPCWIENAVSLLHSLITVIQYTNQSSSQEDEKNIVVQSEVFRTIMNVKKSVYKGTIVFQKQSGIVKMELFKDDNLLLTAESIDNNGHSDSV